MTAVSHSAHNEKSAAPSVPCTGIVILQHNTSLTEIAGLILQRAGIADPVYCTCFSQYPYTGSAQHITGTYHYFCVYRPAHARVLADGLQQQIHAVCSHAM